MGFTWSYIVAPMQTPEWRAQVIIVTFIVITIAILAIVFVAVVGAILEWIRAFW